MWEAHDGMGWWMVFGGILALLFCVGIIALVAWGISKVAGHEASGSASAHKYPLEIARERYARGEISKDQFEQIKKDLT